MVTGQCNCGAVAFEIDAAANDVIVCHCSICRRYTGANGIAVVVVGKDAFRWTRGEGAIRRWRRPVGDWESSFCPTCGSTLPVGNDEKRMAVPAGLLVEAGDARKVKHHIWVDSRAAWDEIGDEGKRHPAAFEA